MSKKTRLRFKKERKRNSHGKNMKNTEEKDKKETYNMKSDFINLAATMIFFSALLLGIYYFDKQNNIMATLVEKLIHLF